MSNVLPTGCVHPPQYEHGWWTLRLRVEKVGIDRSLVLVVSTITDDDVAGISLITMLYL
jgi:hypothetical protein